MEEFEYKRSGELETMKLVIELADNGIIIRNEANEEPYLR